MSSKLPILAALLLSLAVSPGAFASPPTLDDLKKQIISGDPAKAEEIPAIRAEAIEEKALSIGARSGMLQRASEILALLDANSKNLDRLFSFGPLVIDGKVLPPVIVETREALAMEVPDVIRTAERIYRIEQPERFFTVLPTWRDYLYLGIAAGGAVDDPHPQMLPRNDAEAKLWERSLERGWRQGVAQADAIYDLNMSRLQRDYEGMIRYMVLYAKGMISKPVVASSYSLVTGDRKEMAVNDKAHMITEKSGLEVDPNKWAPVIHRKLENE